MARRGPDIEETAQIALVDVATGASRVVAGERSVDVGARWLPDGSFLFVSDADGWFQVVRLTADGHDRIVLTEGRARARRTRRRSGSAPLPSPDGSRFVHIEVHDGLQDLRVGELAGTTAPKRGRGRPPKTPRTVSAASTGNRINPWDGVWRPVGWLTDGAWVAAVGERESAPQDLWLLPVPGVAPDDARPRQVTDSLPVVLRAALSPSRLPTVERVTVTARDGLAVEGNLWRPLDGDRQAWRGARPDDHLPARRPDRAVVPLVPAVQASARRRGVRILRRRFPGFDRIRAGVPARQPRRMGSRRRRGPDRRRPLGDQPAVVRWPAGDLRWLVRRLHGPERAGRGARHVGGRRRPLRRLGDRRELPPRRPARPPRPPQDDGLTRRRRSAPRSIGAARRSIAPSGSRRRC